jgi:hypothetical protein
MTRAIVELSVATRIPFSELVDLDPGVIATYTDVLNKRKG